MPTDETDMQKDASVSHWRYCSRLILGGKDPRVDDLADLLAWLHAAPGNRPVDYPGRSRDFDTAWGAVPAKASVGP